MVNATKLTSASKSFTQHLMRLARNLTAVHFPTGAVSVRLTGMLVFGVDIEASTEHDLLLMDGAAFPIALVILALVLRAFRLLVIPVLNIATGILVAFTIMLPVTAVMDVISFAPSVMMSTCIAMSIDYSLFLLSRSASLLGAAATGPHRAVPYQHAGLAGTARSCSTAATRRRPSPTWWGDSRVCVSLCVCGRVARRLTLFFWR